MIRVSAVVLTAVSCLLLAGPASAHRLRHHHRHPHHRHFHHHHRYGQRGPVTIGLGETIISGKTGLHRSDFGTMVPDSDPTPNFIASGRATGSGPGADGLPGSNQ